MTSLRPSPAVVVTGAGINGLVAAWHHRTGQAHGITHAALRKECGVALDIAQQGLTPDGAKSLKGKASGAMQLSEDYHGDTYRAVYMVELEGCLYVLHCFQKKSKKGAETPEPDLDLIESRLKAARALHADRQRKS